MVPEAAAARREAELLRMQASLSAGADRERNARVFLLGLLPFILVIVTVLTLIEWLDGSLPGELWYACGAFWLLQLLCVVALRRGAKASTLAGLALLLAGCVELAAMFVSPDPLGASATMVFFVVATSYFLGAWATIAYTLAATAAITVASHMIEDWGDDFLLPTTGFILLITGLLCAFVMSRVRRTERRLEELARQQLGALERLEQVDRSRDRLIANVSHELRTPLTSTIGSIETLLRDDVQLDDASRARLMHVARDGGLRLLALVEDLLTLGATRPDSLELAAAPEQLADLARDAIVGIDPGEDRAIVLDVRDDPLVHVDRMRLLQVVANLVVNAIRHGEGDVEVRTGVEDGQAVLRVIDAGSGIDSRHLDELFLPFARFSTRPDSTGLGLAICRTIVEAHGGTIDYARDGEPPRTCFTVRLPAPETSEPRR